MTVGVNEEQWEEWLNGRARPSAHVHVTLRTEDSRQEHVVRPGDEDPLAVLGREFYRRLPSNEWIHTQVIGGAAMWTTPLGWRWTVAACERDGCLVPQNYPQVPATRWPYEPVVPGTTEEADEK